MYSQTNIFSQGGELSQLSLPLPSQNKDKNYEHNTYNRNSLNQDDISHYSEHENAETCSNFQPHIPEESLSSRADAICEENRQIRCLVENNLKLIDKKRIKLTNKLYELEQEEKRYFEIHDHRSHQSLQLQMSLEGLTENYQNALNQWSKVAEKLQRTELLIEVFKNNYDEGINLGESEKALEHLNFLFEENRAVENTTEEKIQKMKSSFSAEMEDIIKKCQDLKQSVFNKRKASIVEIQTLAFSNDQISSKNNNTEEESNQLINKKMEISNQASNLTLQNKAFNEEITKLHQQLNEFRAVSALNVQNSKLQLNTEENLNSNLDMKIKEKEDSLNIISTKYKDSVNLSNQLNMATQEKLKCNQEQLKKIEDFQEQKRTLSKQTQSISENITNYENAENENTLINSKICALEKIIKVDDEFIIGKSEVVDKLKNRVKDSEKVLDNLQVNLSQLNSELKQLKSKGDEYISKLRDDKLLYQQERTSSMLQIETMEQANMDIASKLNKMSINFKESQLQNETLQIKIHELKGFIKRFSTNSQECDKKFLIAKREWEDKCKISYEKILSKNKELESYEDLLIELKPEQQELPALREKKIWFECEICEENEKFQKDKDVCESTFKSQMLELEREKENHTFIMIQLLTAQKEAIEKMKEDTKLTEKTKMRLINELRSIHQQLGFIKKEEEDKRIKVAKMEKRMQTINKQIKVTRQDICDAITGNVEKPKKSQSSTKLMTPTSSGDSMQHQNNPPFSKLVVSKDLDFMSNVLSQKNMKKMEEMAGYVPYDEYDFTEV